MKNTSDPTHLLDLHKRVHAVRTIRLGDATIALKMHVENSVDLVLLNIVTAGMNGLSFARDFAPCRCT